jgi:hypothetical protein
MNKEFSEYYQTLRYLKKRLPIVVSVRRIPLPEGIDGFCFPKDDKFVIQIEKTLPEFYAIDVLIHELSHALSWDKDKKNIHGKQWGKAYSLVYSTFESFSR